MPDDNHPNDYKVVAASDPKQQPTAVSTTLDAAAPNASRRRLWLVAGPLVIAIAGFASYMLTGQYITTQNAYVKAHKIAISADVDGRVVAVHVGENQQVSAGDPLFELDRRPFTIALARADAEMGIVAQEIQTYRTGYRQQLASLEIAEGDLAFAQREFQRQKTLKARGISSEMAYDEKRHGLDDARRRLLATQEAVSTSLARLGSNADIATEQHPRFLEALTRRDQATLDMDHTSVSAPASGIVNNVRLQPGEFVEAGEAAFSLVVSGTQWVAANLKETELGNVKVGQAATITADSYPDYVWQATIESIAPATGAEFALLPPQNASGNWVKVVQRIPVRLNIIDPQSGPPLRAGMSVEVSIDTQVQRQLPGPLRDFIAWLRSNNQTTSAAPAYQ